VRVTLRPAAIDDREVVWQINNDPGVRANSINPNAIPWENHTQWFSTVLKDANRELLIAETAGETAGVVRFDLLSSEVAEVSIALAPASRGRGIGRQVLMQASHEYLARRPLVRAIRARVKPDNAASTKAFVAAGYQLTAADPSSPLLELLLQRHEGSAED
jgi:UDP-2,4-diacetamido-2,4,6-trideoxy-beta-L-altropyranose hydrolase